MALLGILLAIAVLFVVVLVRAIRVASGRGQARRESGGETAMPYLVMQGNPVFRWASFAMAKIGQQALDRAGIRVDQLDCFVPHQANMRITDAMARSMKLPETVKIARDIAEQGNTSAASIPLALDRMYADGDARSGDTALLIAFGAGLAYAAQVVVLP